MYNARTYSQRTMMMMMMLMMSQYDAAPARLSQHVSSVAALPHQTGGGQLAAALALAAGRVSLTPVDSTTMLATACTLVIHSSAVFVSCASLLPQQTGCLSV
jgi:hypothetical protein